jgi:hypothetical protein
MESDIFVAANSRLLALEKELHEAIVQQVPREIRNDIIFPIFTGLERTGEWSDEERAYANAFTDRFMDGVFDLPQAAMLEDILARRLCW